METQNELKVKVLITESDVIRALSLAKEYNYTDVKYLMRAIGDDGINEAMVKWAANRHWTFERDGVIENRKVLIEQLEQVDLKVVAIAHFAFEDLDPADQELIKQTLMYNVDVICNPEHATMEEVLSEEKELFIIIDECEFANTMDLEEEGDVAIIIANMEQILREMDAEAGF